MTMVVSGWTMYNSEQTSSADELVSKYAGLVKRIAHHLLGRLPSSVQAEDLIQAGMIGLLEAFKNYDKSKGASFETYAGIRIKGSMLDEIRKGDWAPRSVHRNTRLIAQAIRKIENETGRDARDHEVAGTLNISLDEYHQMLQDSVGTRIFGFDDIGISDNSMAEGLIGCFPGPLDKLQRADFKKNLAHEIAGLPERERLVLALYYEEELNLREVGDVLGVSESRISQIHSQAMLRLQARMKKWDF
jgi:RNA polymerase sigma factor FliA